jgi:hypothetical protein
MTIDYFPQGVFFLLPFHLMPDHLPVDHLPWVFRDVAHYGGIGPPDTLRRRCVYVKSVGDEIYINIQHIGIHWLVERTQTKKSTSYPFHDFQRVDCVKHGPGPRYVVSYGDSDPFSIPSAIYRFNDNRPENLILHEGGHRLQFAKNVGLPYVLMMIKEEHYQKGEYRKDKTKQYIVSVDPHRIHIQIPVKGYKYIGLWRTTTKVRDGIKYLNVGICVILNIRSVSRLTYRRFQDSIEKLTILRRLMMGNTSFKQDTNSLRKPKKKSWMLS